MPKVKVRALRGFCIGAGENVAPGDVFEAEDYNAREWVGIGHVEKVVEAPAPPPPVVEEKSDEKSGDEHPETKGDDVKHREPSRRKT